MRCYDTRRFARPDGRKTNTESPQRNSAQSEAAASEQNPQQAKAPPGNGGRTSTQHNLLADQTENGEGTPTEEADTSQQVRTTGQEGEQDHQARASPAQEDKRGADQDMSDAQASNEDEQPQQSPQDVDSQLPRFVEPPQVNTSSWAETPLGREIQHNIPRSRSRRFTIAVDNVRFY
jgi:hypothetical protein